MGEKQVRVLHVVVDNITRGLKLLVFLCTKKTRCIQEDRRQWDHTVKKHALVL